MDATGRAAFQERMTAPQRDWREAAARRIRPDDDGAQTLAAWQVQVLAGVPGTPKNADDIPGARRDVRRRRALAAQYGGERGATFVRDTLAVWADREAARSDQDDRTPGPPWSGGSMSLVSRRVGR